MYANGATTPQAGTPVAYYFHSIILILPLVGHLMQPILACICAVDATVDKFLPTHVSVLVWIGVPRSVCSFSKWRNFLIMSKTCPLIKSA